MPDWTDLTFAYAGYLAALAWLLPRFRRARAVSLVATAIAGLVWWWWSAAAVDAGTGPAWIWVVVPSLAVLATYRVSGAYFVAPSDRLEERLLSFDEALLHRTGLLRAYREAPRAVSEIFEAFYVLVYVVLPSGATVLIASGSRHALDSYWTTVFLAELICYAALPWLQSRPPRALEAEPASLEAGPVRRLNRWLLDRGSIQVNTVPSGHAAGSIAVALAMWSAAPAAGAVFLAIGGGITAATVLGRYHYALDSILGVAVAVASWAIVRALTIA